MVFVPLILEHIKQSSLINGFPPCLSERLIKHSLPLSLLPPTLPAFQSEAVALQGPGCGPLLTTPPPTSSAGVMVCLISLVQMSLGICQYSLTDTSWYLPLVQALGQR